MSNDTTVWVDTKTRDKLRIIADSLERSMAGQVRFMVDREYGNLKSQGFIVDKQVEEEEEE